ncbi:response regulator transcription factor [soil metagenome]
MKKIYLGLVDDQRLFRQSLATVISTVPEFELALEAENGIDCLEQLSKLKQLPDVLLMDMEMPEMNGIELNEKIHTEYPSVKVIVLSMYNREKQISRMINAGACGYLEKNCDTAELILAIQTVCKSGFYMNSIVLHTMQKKANSSSSKHNKTLSAIELTGRETEVLKLICKEYSNAEIAKTLFISVRTAEGHRNNLLIKTGCRNTTGLVLFAVKQGYSDLIF